MRVLEIKLIQLTVLGPSEQYVWLFDVSSIDDTGMEHSLLSARFFVCLVCKYRLYDTSIFAGKR